MKDKPARLFPALLIAAGIALMAAGAYNGEFRAILLNAKILCLSCIGVQ